MNSFRYLKTRLIKTVFTASVAVMLSGVSNAQQVLPSASGSVDANPPPFQALPDGATIKGARETISNMSSEAGKSLEKLMGGAVNSRTSTEVGAMAERKRSIMMLELQRDEAKLAKELFFELEGGKDKTEEEINRLQEENTSLKSSLEEAKKQPAAAVSSYAANPVVTEIVGSGGGLRATVSYPGSGSIIASPGAILQNGWKVISVSSKGVVADDGGTRRTLGFGKAFN